METTNLQDATTKNVQNYAATLRNLTKSSAIYALGSIGSPLVSLILSPFITHHLSTNDYGMFAVLVAFVGLGAGITQLGLNSAFFRTYNFDFTTKDDRRSVLATIYILLSLVAIPLTVLALFIPSALSSLVLGSPSLGQPIILVAVTILCQNLTVPALAWLRAESRAALFTIVSIGIVVVNATVTILCVGVFHLGLTGTLIGMCSGYGCVVVCTAPLIVWHSRLKFRLDIARSMLAFGLPLVASFLASWILQLSDRFLLSRLDNYAETASYAVAYNLGSVLSTLVIGPFILAWPTAMFTIAREPHAAQAFGMVFRYFGFFLLFCAFVLSFAGMIVLNWLFPIGYHAAAPVIPIVATSIAFSGIYYIFMIGANVQRKTWLTAIFTAVAAITNFTLNLLLIPLFGAMGAAVTTLIAYAILTLLAFLVNQRIYPLPFEIGRFLVALLLGAAIYGSCYAVINLVGRSWSGPIWIVGVFGSLIYAVSLAWLGGISVTRIRDLSRWVLIKRT